MVVTLGVSVRVLGGRIRIRHVKLVDLNQRGMLTIPTGDLGSFVKRLDK